MTVAGMITSGLGLLELQHISTPAGLSEIAAGSLWSNFPDITDLPVLLVPGVRCSWKNSDSVVYSDVMRGEETLCMGLRARDAFGSAGVVLNLGSHWKLINVDERGRIRASLTSLSGEMIQAAQTKTILSSSVDWNDGQKLSVEWVERGMREQQESSLPRAMFCVRLFELANEGSVSDRLSFLIGAFIAADLDVALKRDFIRPGTELLIAGNAEIGYAWQSVLKKHSIDSVVLTASETDQSFVSGLTVIVEAAKPWRSSATELIGVAT